MKRHLSTLLKSSDRLIFYRAQTQYDNLGDLIINRILLNKLKHYGAILVDLRGVPDWYYEQLELTEAERASQYGWKMNYLMFFAAVRSRFSPNPRKIYLIEPPGHRYGKLSVQQLKNALLSFLYYCIFRLLGVRICTFGVSIGPCAKTPEILEWWRSNLFYFYSLRDSISQNYARRIGVRRVVSFPDLAWLADVPAAAPTSFLLPKEDYIIFSFREQTHNLVESSEYQQQLYQTLDAIVAQVCQTWSKKLVISYQVGMDQRFCKHLAERYSSLHTVQFVEERVDLDSMQQVYGGAFMVFSNRLHVLMLAMLYGAIPIAVIDKMNHHKIMGIFQDADLKPLLLDVTAGSDSLKILSALAEDAPAIQQKLATCYAQTRAAGNTLLHQIMTSP